MSIKAVILCGGQGTRIREASEHLPKPMLPIGGKPIVWHIMKYLTVLGINEFVLCLGYKGWVIKEFFLNYRAMTSDVTIRLGRGASVTCHDAGSADEWSVTLAETGEDTATGGRVAAIRRYVEGPGEFLLTYGDGVGDVDVHALRRCHRELGRVTTVTAVRPPGRFGEMRLEGSHVREFNEKPQATEGFINGGFMICDSRRVWSYLGSDPKTMLEREPMQKLAAEGQLAAYRHMGFWQPMDTYREYVLLNELWSSGQAPWYRWGPAPR